MYVCTCVCVYMCMCVHVYVCRWLLVSLILVVNFVEGSVCMCVHVYESMCVCAQGCIQGMGCLGFSSTLLA